MIKTIKYKASIILFLFLASCATKIQDEEIVPAETIYEEAEKLLKLKKYESAADKFDQIYFLNPGSELTIKSEIMSMYSYFLSGKYKDVISKAKNFQKVHPLYKNLEYVIYLKAMSYYAQISDTGHEQSNTINAKLFFNELITNYPESKYSKSAKIKLPLIEMQLAEKEMKVGMYYLNKKNPLAAYHRFSEIVEKFQKTAYIQEALYRIVECNLLLGLSDEAKKYASILMHNYPNSNWYKLAYNLIVDTK